MKAYKVSFVIFTICLFARSNAMVKGMSFLALSEIESCLIENNLSIDFIAHIIRPTVHNLENRMIIHEFQNILGLYFLVNQIFKDSPYNFNPLHETIIYSVAK